MSAPPPGYSDPDATARPTLATPVMILATTGAVLALAFYDVGVATPTAFALASHERDSLALALVGAGVGALAAQRIAPLPRNAALALTAASWFCCLSAYGFVLAFTAGDWLRIATLSMPVLAGAVLAIAASLTLRTFGPSLAATDGLALLLNPWRTSCLALAVLGSLLLFPQLGLVRRAALLGSLLAGAAVLSLWVGHWFVLPSVALRTWVWALRAAPCLALLSLAGAERVAPSAAVKHHAGEVLYVLDSGRSHHVFAKIQGGLVLFSDRLLALTSIDAARFAEALVHPALGAIPSRRSILVLDDGAGSVLREVLRWRDVERVTLVPNDPALQRLASSSVWLRELGASAAAEPRVSVDAREPSVFVLRGTARFDAILANLADPTSYSSGKYATRAWFSAVRERLAAGGLLALQVTSPERTPSTHASLLKTLEAAGFAVRSYRAPLPTMGEWGFAVAAPASDALAMAALARIDTPRSFPSGTSLVASSTIAALFAEPATPRAANAVVNHLYDQPLVELYHSEERSLGE